MDFRSDNVVGAAPDILQSVIDANQGTVTSYGNDPYSERVEQRLSATFEKPVRASARTTGTAANARVLSAARPTYGAIVCHDEAHMHLDECGAPELFSGGAKVVPLAGPSGKISIDALRTMLDQTLTGDPHRVQPAALSITQATEAGTCYRPAEI